MTQAIAAIGSVPQTTIGELPKSPLPATTADARASAPSLPETRAAARQHAEAQGRYQVHIHAETMRIITEVVDMATGDVVMYFPPGYRPDAEPKKADGDNGADSTHR